MIRRAQRLEEVYNALQPNPLLTKDELDAFYRDDLNVFRGSDIVADMALGLGHSHGAANFHAIVMGHRGVGKSTEMTRLTVRVQDKFRPLRFSMTKQLDPVAFKPFDVLLLMLCDVVAEMTNAGLPVPVKRLEEVWAWFATEKETVERATSLGVAGQAGAGLPPESVLAKVLGLFATLRGEFRYATARRKETVEYRLSRLDTLTETANRLLDDCNKTLREEEGQEWLFIGEDFDKQGVSPEPVKDLFVNYASALRDLRAHWILNVPIELGYSWQAANLPAPRSLHFRVPDTMVFDADHRPHVGGRGAMSAILDRRMDLSLLDAGQAERLIVASGGNLHDLFTLVLAAASKALVRNDAAIRVGDATQAIGSMRTEYENRLGESPFDYVLTDGGQSGSISYQDKARRLLGIYRSDASARVPDAVLYSLLRARAVQEFNGKRWFGVHPLVVDILAEQGVIPRPAEGPVPGGTE